MSASTSELPTSTKTSRARVTPARLPTAATLFICIKCSAGKRRRQELKAALKAAGGKRQLRIVGCGCLDLCPKRGTATVLVNRREPAYCSVIRDDADASGALATLLARGAGSDEQ